MYNIYMITNLFVQYSEESLKYGTKAFFVSKIPT